MADPVKKILMIDDDEIQLAIAQSVLRSDYQISMANSGQEGLQLIYKGLIPDLILLDIMMPGMDGWETFRRIKAITILHSIPIAFITSISEEDSIKRANELGASDYITKPYSSDDLLSRVSKILEKK